MNKNKIYIPLFLMLAIALGIIIGSFLNYPRNSTAMLFSRDPQEAKIKRLIDYIQHDYVDKVDTDSLLDGTIRQILSKLDPHSVYIPASEHEKIAESMNGEFVGVGVQFRMYNDTLTVIKVVKDGPSDNAGIKDGDRILIANNDTLYNKHLDSDYIMKTLKGAPNTNVDLKVYRKSDKSLLNFNVKRGSIPIKSVVANYMLNDSLGYIKIDKFASTTYDEFKGALTYLQKKGMNELVLDLRGNPGGYMNVATRIADEFLKDGKLIVFTKNKGGKIEKTYATKKGSFENGKLYVLIDANSASASEIVAGALQDNDKGTIVGRRSFGKGLVQQEMSLGDGSAVRLTVSRYYTPTGRSIQKPYSHVDENSYYNDRVIRFYHGELTNADSIKVNDSLKYVTPKGKIVYGGGGIIPDVFVPIDTTANYVGVNLFLNDFVFNYVDTHRKTMKKMIFEEFDTNFDKDNKILNEYVSIIQNKGKITIKDTTYLKLYLRAFFARLLVDDSAYYRIINEHDEMLKKVNELETESEIVTP